MKRTVVGCLCLIAIIVFLFIIKIPKYVELNNLVIVEGIGVKCDKEKYTLYLREIIPLKDDTGISYKHKIYASDDFPNLQKAYKNITTKMNKKIFYKDTKYIVTNCKKSDKILEYFEVKPNYIEHTEEDIFKILKKK